MKTWLLFIVLNGSFAAAVWFGFIEDVQGAQNLAKAFVWLFALATPVALYFAPSMSTKRSVALYRVWLVLATLALGVFIWYGHIATAVAWGVVIFCVCARANFKAAE